MNQKQSPSNLAKNPINFKNPFPLAHRRDLSLSYSLKHSSSISSLKSFILFRLVEWLFRLALVQMQEFQRKQNLATMSEQSSERSVDASQDTFKKDNGSKKGKVVIPDEFKINCLNVRV